MKWFVAVVLIFFLAGCIQSSHEAQMTSSEWSNIADMNYSITEDGRKYIIHPNEILSGGSPVLG